MKFEFYNGLKKNTYRLRIKGATDRFTEYSFGLSRKDCEALITEMNEVLKETRIKGDLK